MLSVGLTGKIGSGKSTVASALRARGALVIDTDAIAREVLAPGSAATWEVLRTFGPSVQGADGTLDRAALARLALASPDSRARLEEITHPLIRQEVACRRQSASGPVLVIEIPLLDRRRAQEYDLDAVVVVDVPTDLAVSRAVARGMVRADVLSRLAAQPTDQERRSIADYVLNNSGPLPDLEQAVDRLWAWLQDRLGGPAATDWSAAARSDKPRNYPPAGNGLTTPGS